MGAQTDTINNSNINNLTISHTHHSRLTSTHTLTVRINAHPSPIQHLPPPPYHSCNVTLVSRDNGFLRASAVAPINPIHLPACVSNQGHIPCSYPMFISQSTTKLHTTLKSASSFPSTYSSFLIGSHSSIAPEHATFFQARHSACDVRTTVQPLRSEVCASFYSHTRKSTWVPRLHVYKTVYLALLQDIRAELQDILITLQCSTT